MTAGASGGERPARGRGGLRPATIALPAVAGLVCLFALGAPWLSTRYADRGQQLAHTDPAAAEQDFLRAADTNPLDPQPLLLAGAFEASRNQPGPARSAFSRSLGREQTWLGHFGLGVIAAEAGDRTGARAQFDRARAISPLETTLPGAVRAALSAHPPSAAALLRRALTEPLPGPAPVLR